MQKRSNVEITSEVILKVLNWIENIFIYIFKGKKASKEKKQKDKLKEKMRAAKRASIEGDADTVNLIVENTRQNKIVHEQVKK